MDKTDNRLIHLLDINSREKESSLAKKLETSKQVVRYRIKRLTEEGIIKKFQTIINLESLGIGLYANIYFKLAALDKSKEKKLLDHLIQDNNVGYVALTGGRFDLSIVLVAKSLTEIESKLSKIIHKHPELNNYSISLRTKGFRFNKKYICKEKKPTTKMNKLLTNNLNPQKIDSLDKSILEIISKNSRTPILEVARILNKPFSTIRSRLVSLESTGIISGYSVLLDLEKMGMQNYKVFLNVNDRSNSTEEKLKSLAEENPNITWFFKTIGDHNYELRVESSDQKSFQELLRTLRSEFPKIIEEAETLIIFKELKEEYSTIVGAFNNSS